jgi:hypothetical protein
MQTFGKFTFFFWSFYYFGKKSLQKLAFQGAWLTLSCPIRPNKKEKPLSKATF